LNWGGQPLINYETIINLIGAPRRAPGSKSRQSWTRMSNETGNQSVRRATR
jgi:hypothetical protein